jgi:hypothetical protein
MSRRTPRRRHGGASISQPNTTESVPMPIEKWLGRSRSGSYRTQKASSSTLGRRDTFTTKRRHWLKVCPTDRATAIAGWEAEHDGTCKGEIAAKACNKMKCKTHGEVSGCATQKQADSGKNRCWFVKESHKCGGDVIDPEAMPGRFERYFCEDHVPSRCLRSAKSRAATDASKRWKKLSEFVNTRDATLCLR